MKKNFVVCNLLILIAFGLSISCDDPDDDAKLPEITSVGKGTFGALVNGTVWLPCCGPNAQPTTVVDQTVSGFIWVGADNNDSGIRVAVHYTGELEVNKVYPLSTSSSGNYSQYYKRLDKGACFYDEPHVIDGHIIFSKVTSGIISGTFTFRMLNPECSSDTLHVTDGRFDLR